MKIVEKNEKLFTKDLKKDIIKKNNFLLTKDSCNRYFLESEGLVMKETEDVILEEVLEKLNWKERVVVKIFKQIFIKVYKIGITFGFNNK